MEDSNQRREIEEFLRLQRPLKDPNLQMSWAGLFSFIGILATAIFDLGMVVFKGVASSISQFLITTAFKSPLVSFAFGCTVGHLFFYMAPLGCTMDWTERLIVAGCGAVFGIGCFILIKALTKLIRGIHAFPKKTDHL